MFVINKAHKNVFFSIYNIQYFHQKARALEGNEKGNYFMMKHVVKNMVGPKQKASTSSNTLEEQEV